MKVKENVKKGCPHHRMSSGENQGDDPVNKTMEAGTILRLIAANGCLWVAVKTARKGSNYY